jgi:hypothetical protein
VGLVNKEREEEERREERAIELNLFNRKIFSLSGKKKQKKQFQDGPPCPQVINAVVEIGRGSKVKYELDKVRLFARRKGGRARGKERKAAAIDCCFLCLRAL